MPYSPVLIFNYESSSEAERREKRRLYRIFMEALMADTIKDRENQELQIAISAINSWKEDVPREKCTDLAKAISVQLTKIEKEKEKAKKRVKNIKVAKQEDQIVALATQLVIACDMFSAATEKANAAALAETIDVNLKTLCADEETFKASGLSKELIEQAREAVTIGTIIKEGLKALESEFSAKADNRPLSAEESSKNLSAIVKMQLVHPSNIIMNGKAPELVELEQQMKKPDQPVMGKK